MKDYRTKELVYSLMIYSGLLLLWCTSTFTVGEDFTSEQWISLLEGVMITGVFSLVVFLGDALIESSAKDRLVGLFFMPCAGEKVFTNIQNKKNKDKRFLNAEAEKMYQDIFVNIPSSVKEKRAYENAEWYAIYNRHNQEDRIKQAQGDYLLCRDIYVQTIAFFCVYFVSLILFKETIFWSNRFIIVLIFMIAVSNAATHIKMSRFVSTVIAIDIASKKKEAK